MIRVLLALMLVLGVWAGLATWGVLHLRGKNATVAAELRGTREALERARSAAKRADATLVSLRRKNAATARAAASAGASLSSAAASSPDWSATPVPQAVREALK